MGNIFFKIFLIFSNFLSFYILLKSEILEENQNVFWTLVYFLSLVSIGMMYFPRLEKFSFRKESRRKISEENLKILHSTLHIEKIFAFLILILGYFCIFLFSRSFTEFFLISVSILLSMTIFLRNFENFLFDIIEYRNFSNRETEKRREKFPVENKNKFFSKNEKNVKMENIDNERQKNKKKHEYIMNYMI
jgi:hypothetical protein